MLSRALPGPESAAKERRRPAPPAPVAARTGHVETPAQAARSGIAQSVAGVIQARLLVGASNDPAEREADAMAARVMRSLRTPQPADGVRTRTESPDLARRIQRRVGASAPGIGAEGGQLDGQTERALATELGRGGTALPDTVLQPMEHAFGADFSNVRVHQGAGASSLSRSLNAEAFTLGNDIFLSEHAPSPASSRGHELLAHELTHTIQQGAAPPGRVHRLMSAPDFQKSAKEKIYETHGKTMSEVDVLLASYDSLKVRGGHLERGQGGIDKAINILTQIQQVIAFWMKSHDGDKKRKKQREALDVLKIDVATELQRMSETREAFADLKLVGDLKKEDSKFVQKMEGSASSLFAKLSPIIAGAVPSPGDGAEFEIAVKIPVDPSTAGYVGFSLGIKVQRQDNKSTKISMKAAVNGGVQVMGTADVGLELGAFIEAQGKDPKAALTLLSWGWYRRFRESVLPREVASFMWGGAPGSVGYKRSETWAANVEKKYLDYDPKSDANPNGDKDLSSGVGSGSTTNAHVRTGAYGSAAASGTIAGIAELEGSATLTGGTHYDKDTIGARKAKRGAKIGEAEDMPTRGTTTYLGTRFMKLEAGLGVSVGPFSGSLSGALEWMWDQTPDPKHPGKKKGVRLEYLSASFSAGATVPLGGQLADQLADGVMKLAPSAVNLIKTLATKATKEDPMGTPEGLGQLAAQGEAVAIAFNAFPQDSFSFTDFSISDDPMKGLGEQLKSAADVGESASTISVAISIGKNLWDRSAPIAIDLTLNSEQGIQLDASIVAVKAVRTRRVLRLKFTAAKKWKFEVD